MLKRFFVFLMTFSLLSAHLAHAMSSDEESDGEDFPYTARPLKVPPSARGDSLDPQDIAFISLTFASLFAAFYFVLKSKPK